MFVEKSANAVIIKMTIDLENRIKAYRFVAYSAVTFSVVAVLSVCVTLPMVYNYVHHVRRQMHNEITYCKVKKIWSKSNLNLLL